MITEKCTVKYECVFDDTRAHRFVWRKTFDKDKGVATVVMLNPAVADTMVEDLTTYLVNNNIAKLDRFGCVQIVNLYSLLTPKLNFRWNSDEELNAPENDSYIKKAAEESEVVILAFGKSGDNNQRIADRAEAVIKLLEKHKDKLYVITDGFRKGIHPLTPSIRSHWDLVKYYEE